MSLLPRLWSRRSIAPVIAAHVFVATALSGADASAQDDNEKRACVSAFEKAQALRQNGLLSAAKAELALCTRPVCPQLVREECAQWTADVTRVTPSLLLAVRDGTGRDITHARVFVDDAPLPNGLDGKPIAMDPGRHAIRVEAAGMTPVTEPVVMREAERDRPLTVIMQPVPASAPVAPPAPERGAAPPILAYALAGAGVAALGAAVVLDLSAAADVRQLRDTCAPYCSEGDVDAAKQKHYVALALGGAGVAAAGAGVILLVTRSRSTPERTGFAVVPGPRGASLSWRARF